MITIGILYTLLLRSLKTRGSMSPIGLLKSLRNDPEASLGKYLGCFPVLEGKS